MIKTTISMVISNKNIQGKGTIQSKTFKNGNHNLNNTTFS